MNQENARQWLEGAARIFVPPRWRPTLRRGWNTVLAPLRLDPSFLIIGAQRGGTTSMYSYLTNQPPVLPASWKEVHYFDENFDKGVPWYRAHFPMISPRVVAARAHGAPLVTGEASPSYLFHPLAPRRVRRALPHVKLIALLRDPVERTIAHYTLERRRGYHSASLEEVIRGALAYPASLEARIEAAENRPDWDYRHHSQLARGIYVDQLINWRRYFPAEQLLILRSEDLFADPLGITNQVLQFLGLPERRLETYPAHNSFEHAPVEPAMREFLIEYFRPHNQRLYEYLGRDFGWLR